ncbi:MAG TPA: SMI1/KNR4 family protein [Polyangiaceae bacterium]
MRGRTLGAQIARLQAIAERVTTKDAVPSPAQLDALEARLAIEFPAEIRAFLLQHGLFETRDIASIPFESARGRRGIEEMRAQVAAYLDRQLEDPKVDRGEAWTANATKLRALVPLASLGGSLPWRLGLFLDPSTGGLRLVDPSALGEPDAIRETHEPFETVLADSVEDWFFDPSTSEPAPRVVASLELVALGDGIAATGFEGGVANVRHADRFEIGRKRFGHVCVTATDGRSVLGGRLSYLVMKHGKRWTIVHTGHIGSFVVDGARHHRGDVELHDGSVVELLDCDAGARALVFRLRVRP